MYMNYLTGNFGSKPAPMTGAAPKQASTQPNQRPAFNSGAGGWQQQSGNKPSPQGSPKVQRPAPPPQQQAQGGKVNYNVGGFSSVMGNRDDRGARKPYGIYSYC